MNAAELLKKYKEGKCTPEELALLETWYLEHYPEASKHLKEEDREEDMLKIHRYLNNYTIKDTNYRLRWPYAAAILLFGICVCWWSINRWKTKVTEPKATLVAEAKPGSNKAYLTLANGEKIALGNKKDGLVILQNGVKVSRTANGKLVYEDDALVNTRGANTNSLTYNSISTPRGGQFAIGLPDGTQVWLNAESRLRYPVHFSGSDRSVELTGEAYFEVAQDKTRPFKVATKRSDGSQFLVEVLGTQFNINAYQKDKVIKTTLVEGRIQTALSGQNDKSFLKPGEQVLLKNNKMNIVKVNVNDEVAWKEGNFAFKDTEIHEVMQQLTRWYNLSVSYEGSLRKETFTGYVSRNVPLKDVLAMLEKGGGVKFKVQGNKVAVHMLD